MAPGPSTGWKLVWRALKAGRHKAARTLKVAGKSRKYRIFIAAM